MSRAGLRLPDPVQSITLIVSHPKLQANPFLLSFHHGWLEPSPRNAWDIKDHLQTDFPAASAL